MSVKFKSGIDCSVYLYGEPITQIRVSAIHGPLLDFGDRVSFDVNDVEAILNKMKELQGVNK